MKTRVKTSAHKVRSELAARAEVMYLELNRGRRGVPRLYGGWRDAREDRVYYVVQRAGSPIVVDEVSTVPSAAWLAFCRADPVGAATALVECFRSFTSSGYFMEDLHGAQFTLAGNDIYAIDAPETLPDAPVAAVLDWTARKGGTSWGGLKYVEMRLSVHQNCTVDGDCPATSDIELCAFRDCVPGWDQGAREARGWCRKGWCAPVDARAHTYDLATRAWCASRVPFSSLRDPRRPAVSQLSPLRSRPRRHRRASTPSTRFICTQGAAVDFEGGPVPVPSSKAAPGRVNKAHAKRGARGPAESLRCSRCARGPSGSVNCGWKLGWS